MTHSQNNFNRVSESYIFIFQNKTPDRLKIEKLKFFYTLIRIFFIVLLYAQYIYALDVRRVYFRLC